MGGWDTGRILTELILRAEEDDAWASASLPSRGQITRWSFIQTYQCLLLTVPEVIHSNVPISATHCTRGWEHKRTSLERKFQLIKLRLLRDPAAGLCESTGKSGPCSLGCQGQLPRRVDVQADLWGVRRAWPGRERNRCSKSLQGSQGERRAWWKGPGGAVWRPVKEERAASWKAPHGLPWT